MRIPRLYLPPPLHPGTRAPLPEPAFAHAVRVLRLRTGAPVILFDGRGGEYQGELVEVERRSARVRIGDHRPCERESPLPLTLVQGLARSERMDYVLQKAVELGVTRLQPVICARSPGPMTPRRLDRRWQHWQGVIASACEQCGRNTLPELGDPLPLTAWLERAAAEGGLRLRLDPGAGIGPRDLLRPEGRVSLLIGPEGGLDETECARADAAGFRALRLGPRVLRTETAGPAATAVLQALWGDLN